MLKPSKDTRLANDFCRIDRIDGFDIPGFPGRKRGFSGFLLFSHFSVGFNQKPERIPYVLGLPYGNEKAGSNLEGGPASLLGGLGYSGGPCAALLSVAGFLVSLGRLPAGKTVYSEEKEASFHPGRGFPR